MWVRPVRQAYILIQASGKDVHYRANRGYLAIYYGLNSKHIDPPPIEIMEVLCAPQGSQNHLPRTKCVQGKRETAYPVADRCRVSQILPTLYQMSAG